jgi:hypothetical protein
VVVGIDLESPEGPPRPDLVRTPQHHHHYQHAGPGSHLYHGGARSTVGGSGSAAMSPIVRGHPLPGPRPGALPGMASLGASPVPAGGGGLASESPLTSYPGGGAHTLHALSVSDAVGRPPVRPASAARVFRAVMSTSDILAMGAAAASPDVQPMPPSPPMPLAPNPCGGGEGGTAGFTPTQPTYRVSDTTAAPAAQAADGDELSSFV